MKHLYLTIALITLFGINIHAQVAIGKDTPHSSAILDFGTDGDKGIVLPYVTSLDPSTTAGTLYFDANANKVKFKGNSEVDLSVKGVSAGSEFNPNANGYGELQESADVNGTVLGATTSTSPGVLVLESHTKAMILPVASSYEDVGDPAPGTIVYDSTKKLLCVYDGEKWAFWGRD